MNERASIEYTPPGKYPVVVSLNPDTWPSVGEYGNVPHWAVAPDPEQCRKQFSKSDLESLAESIKERGQMEAAVVRLYTPEERKTLLREHRRALYELVGGERRWRAIRIANIPIIRIIVEEYASRADQHEIGLGINFNRQGLNPIELSDYLIKLKRETGKSNRALGVSIGMHEIEVGKHLRLEVLCPEVRALMLELLPRKEISKQVCMALGEVIDYDAQREYIQTVRDHSEWSSDYAAKWISNQARVQGFSRSIERPKTRDPRKIRARIRTIFDNGAQSSKEMFEFGQSEFGRIFKGLPPDEIDDYMMSLRERHIATAELLDSLAAAAKREKNPRLSSPEQVQKLLGWVIVDYYRGREFFEKRAVGPLTYRALWAGGNLAFQRNSERKPDDYPMPDEYDEMTADDPDERSHKQA